MQEQREDEHEQDSSNREQAIARLNEREEPALSEELPQRSPAHFKGLKEEV